MEEHINRYRQFNENELEKPLLFVESNIYKKENLILAMRTTTNTQNFDQYQNLANENSNYFKKVFLGSKLYMGISIFTIAIYLIILYVLFIYR